MIQRSSKMRISMNAPNREMFLSLVMALTTVWFVSGPQISHLAHASDVPELGLCHQEGSLPSLSGPVEVYPSVTLPIAVEYSSGPDVVRLSGPETEIAIGLGSGADVLVLEDVGIGTSVIAGEGSDVVAVCSMNDLGLGITLGTEDLSRDDDSDVVVIASSVFESVPTAMKRFVLVMSFDGATDRLLIEAPRELLSARRRDASGLWIGDVLVKTTPPIGGAVLRLEEEAFVFVPSDD